MSLCRSSLAVNQDLKRRATKSFTDKRRRLLENSLFSLSQRACINIK